MQLAMLERPLNDPGKLQDAMRCIRPGTNSDELMLETLPHNVVT